MSRSTPDTITLLSKKKLTLYTRKQRFYTRKPRSKTLDPAPNALNREVTAHKEVASLKAALHTAEDVRDTQVNP